MRDGIHIPGVVVRVFTVLFGLAFVVLMVRQVPELRRYLKIDTM